MWQSKSVPRLQARFFPMGVSLVVCISEPFWGSLRHSQVMLATIPTPGANSALKMCVLLNGVKMREAQLFGDQ